MEKKLCKSSVFDNCSAELLYNFSVVVPVKYTTI